MRITAVLFSGLVLLTPAALAADEPAPRPVAAVRPGTVLIADSNSLSFHQSRKEDLKMLSDLDREEAATIMSMNATRGTWQSYLLYTTPEMKVPTSQPGFIITLPPPSRKELERRRRHQSEAAKAAAARAPQPAPEDPSEP